MICPFEVNQTACGYVGLFTLPFADKQYGSCMYAQGNAGNGELCLFLLTPGNYRDAYKMASAITWQDIHIFATTLDLFYISDIYALCLNLQKIKKSVTVHFPKKPEFAESFEFDDRFLFNFDTTPYYKSKADWHCYVEYTTDVTLDCLTFGTVISNGKEKIHIVPYFDEYMIEGLDIESLNPEYQLHVPYLPGVYGGLSWIDLYNDRKYKKYMKYIVPYKFDNWNDFNDAKTKAKTLPKRWGYNVRDRII